MEACLAANTHYLDISGEPLFMEQVVVKVLSLFPILSTYLLQGKFFQMSTYFYLAQCFTMYSISWDYDSTYYVCISSVIISFFKNLSCLIS